MAGFEVATHGRFWVATEVGTAHKGNPRLATTAAEAVPLSIFKRLLLRFLDLLNEAVKRVARHFIELEHRVRETRNLALLELLHESGEAFILPMRENFVLEFLYGGMAPANGVKMRINSVRP
jgi:hypothetical protein